MLHTLFLTFAATLPALSSGHIALWHPSMYGFNVTDHTFPYDNRPVAPIMNMNFDQWWFHGHIEFPPHPEDFFELPAGKPATAELACNKGLTSYFASSEGGDIRTGDNPCPSEDGSFPSGAMHTTGFDDLKGCVLAIAYESDPKKIQPKDFTVFSVNQTCVWTRFTDFQVPERMPPCPEGGCHCAWFWIHSEDSGSEQNYMNAFKCKVTGSTSNVALGRPQVPRRCGDDPKYNKPESPGNCTYGPKQPLYWFQNERNNMFEGTYAPPFYTDLYNFKDGAQNDIFQDSYPDGLSTPSPNSTLVPTPFLGNSSLSSVASGQPSSPTNTPTSTTASDSSSASKSVAIVTTTVVVTVTVTPTATGISTTQPAPTTEGSANASLLNSPPPVEAIIQKDESRVGAKVTSTPVSMHNTLAARPITLVADASPKPSLCSRQLGKRKIFRRRVRAADPTPPPRAPEEKESPDSRISLLSKIIIPGLHRHRKLQDRSRLWSFF